jgi:hypothetical protein
MLFSGDSIWPKLLMGGALSLMVVFAVLMGYIFWYKRRCQQGSNAHYAMDSINFNDISREPICSEVKEQEILYKNNSSYNTFF